MSMLTLRALTVLTVLAASGLTAAVTFVPNSRGQLEKLIFQDGHGSRRIPMRTDGWGFGWYVRDQAGKASPVAMQRTGENTFAGMSGDVRFTLGYRAEGDALKVTVSAENRGKAPFSPMTAGLRLGFNSYQESYPTWLGKLVPNVFRCEPTHAWGFAMSPAGSLFSWSCDTPVASWSINYQPGEHRIYTANIDFINRLPLPAHHPQNLHTLAPGETKTWTVTLSAPATLDALRPTLAKNGGIPLCEADHSLRAPGETARMTVYGPAPARAEVTGPDGKTAAAVPESSADGRTVYALSGTRPGLYRFRSVGADGKEAQGSFFVRRPWRWYLERARAEALRCKPTATHHAESFYPFFSLFLARRYFPDAELDARGEALFRDLFPKHFDADRKQLRVTFRIQDSAAWISVLADRYAATGDIDALEKASNLVDFLRLKCQREDGGFYAHGNTHYTSVLYMAKCIMEYLKEVKPLAADSPLWKERYTQGRDSAVRAIRDLCRRGDRVQTEGQQTYEDGMISCTMTQLSMFALKTDDPELRRACTEVAQKLFEGHRSLTLTGHPDARVNGATIRFWETQYTICLMNNMYNSPCGWSAWKLYGDYYLYLLTGREEYLRHAFNGLGACVQLIDTDTGLLRWGFTPDPFVYARWAEPLEKPTETAEHRWVTGVRGEEYLEPISTWNVSKPIWRRKWGIDNFSHESFKCMTEVALFNAFVLERTPGVYVGYNCAVEMKDGVLHVRPTDATVTRLHLNLKQAVRLETELGGKRIAGTYAAGMQWIGGVPDDLTEL